MIKRLVMLAIGFLTVGFALGLLRLSGLGLDPFATVNLGLAYLTGLSFGTWMMMTQGALAVIIFLKARQLIGLGTAMAVFGVGYAADIFFFLLVDIFSFSVDELWLQLTLLMIAVVILSSGVALLIVSNLWLGPYDAVGVVIEKMTQQKISLRWARMITDTLLTGVAFLIGAPIGIVILVTVFAMGPFINFFRTIYEKLL